MMLINSKQEAIAHLTPLMCAIKMRDKAIIERLLQHDRIDLALENANGHSASDLAQYAGPEIIRLFPEPHGARP